MSSYNKVILMGNLTRDPEVRFTNGGMAVVSAGLAVNERFKDGQGEWQERATFVDVTIWGKRGEAFAKFHKKGRPAFVEGRLRLDTWEDKQGGGKRSKLYVVADNWEFVGGDGPGGSGGGGGGGGESMDSGGDAWGAPAPAQSGGGSGGSGGSGGGNWGAPSGGGPDSFDETPF
ncbi:MAG: single-stranded DNA-binding protein [Planctomycetota bacterium]|nr:single-stranded DNA-binding protein [Planctomycetota bacterium]